MVPGLNEELQAVLLEVVLTLLHVQPSEGLDCLTCALTVLYLALTVLYLALTVLYVP